ncbi:SH3 domain-containing protein [Nannizzia gypsea CBS 118893]|uniref:SH3 domain-containing protein n=1 Tax=Arthroderma gypseum (strain ATCC MYA-4604 / CBS 118893) TaxID=535722 RepID=E4URC1_ARTGP|nr:SH3 domain-containing protein [Nannizzia gypsea CBS 118893]EFR00184.1 SH3 domain-containing protein [Nannizzia gypsea CBS 118893]
MSRDCISLKGSKQCPAFSSASIAVSDSLIGLYPFLRYVSNLNDFDEKLGSYVHNEYVKMKYQDILGCEGLNLKNTTSLYAQYTTSVICNGIIQNSKEPCRLSEENSRPLCAESCAMFATSEERITVNQDLCRSPSRNQMDQIRADFTVCAIPANSLSGHCIPGSDNEPNECGFGPNLLGLCGFCSQNSVNGTDTCCYAANAEQRCKGIKLPEIPTLPPLFPHPTSTTSPSPTSRPGGEGLSGGQIAGIAIGTVLGCALLIGLAVLFILWRRRKQNEPAENIFNQPTPPRTMATVPSYPAGSSSATKQQKGYEPIPGGRVARMSALQSASSPPSRHAYHDSDSDVFGDSPSGGRSRRVPPVTGRRNGSLSSASALAGDGDTLSPKSGSGGQYSSPEGVASGQSEQLSYFRDYYSQDDIHPNDRVSVLWAYQPRAPDEFELDRGDMLKVKQSPLRDSGVSQGSGARPPSSPTTGEIKAFPLVCVCLPQHWRTTIDGYLEGSDQEPST